MHGQVAAFVRELKSNPLESFIEPIKRKEEDKAHGDVFEYNYEDVDREDVVVNLELFAVSQVLLTEQVCIITVFVIYLVVCPSGQA